MRAPLSSRVPSGSTLIETMVVVIITSIISMAMYSVLWMNTKIQYKTNNSLESANAARVAIERIGVDVRSGRSLGDVFGDLSGGLVQGSATFPSSSDPIYGANQAPAGGAWPAAWLPPYTLSNDTLIVQVPVYTASSTNFPKWPTEIPVGSGNPAVTPAMGSQANVETHIYKVIADPNNSGQFLLQYFCAPGFASVGSGYVPSAHTFGPETLVKGIIGPKDPGTGNIKVFQFLAKKGTLDDTSPSGQPQDTVVGTRLANFTGVVVNLEIKKTESSTQLPVVLGFKQEVFVRNNALATAIGNTYNNDDIH